jgi:AcrR family transcriptional regulator
MEVKERIIAQASEAFMREGVRRVTMDNLASSLGMSKRTIYEIHRNKDQILKECIETHIRYQKKTLEELAKSSKTAVHLFLSLLKNGIDNMKSQNPQFINDVRIYYPSIWKSTLCANRDYNNEQTINLLKRGINEGVIKHDIDLQIISKLIMEIFELLANSDIFPYHLYPPSLLYEQTLITLIRGIASAKGLAIIDEFTANKTTS